jgi:hypothetical protein
MEQLLLEQDASLGAGGQVISLTSRRYRFTTLGKARCCTLPILPWC